MPSRVKNRRRQVQGVSLIEVLVTVVVLSIGLLGLAGLQASGTKFNHSAYMRSQAVSLAYDVADRMRANLGADYTTNLAAVFDPATGPACMAELGAVTVARDVNQWKNCIENILPEGRGEVLLLAAAPGAAYVDACGVAHARANRAVWIVQVTWDNSRLQNEGPEECVVVRTEVAPL